MLKPKTFGTHIRTGAKKGLEAPKTNTAFTKAAIQPTKKGNAPGKKVASVSVGKGGGTRKKTTVGPAIQDGGESYLARQKN